MASRAILQLLALLRVLGPLFELVSVQNLDSEQELMKLNLRVKVSQAEPSESSEIHIYLNFSTSRAYILNALYGALDAKCDDMPHQDQVQILGTTIFGVEHVTIPVPHQIYLCHP